MESRARRAAKRQKRKNEAAKAQNTVKKDENAMNLMPSLLDDVTNEINRLERKRECMKALPDDVDKGSSPSTNAALTGSHLRNFLEEVIN